jgi:hypothetical protein
MKGSKEKAFVDVVSQDKDWRGVIDNELRCAENWHKDWGFLADNTGIYSFNLVSENPLSKAEKIQVIEEQLKSMSNVKLTTTMRQCYKGGGYDLKISTNNKRKVSELMPQSRRPKVISKAHAHLSEALGPDYENRESS